MRSARRGLARLVWVSALLPLSAAYLWGRASRDVLLGPTVSRQLPPTNPPSAPALVCLDRNRKFHVNEIYTADPQLRKRKQWRLADLQRTPDSENLLLWTARLRRVRWAGARLSNVSLWDFDFTRADMRGIEFADAGLRFADLRRADLSAARLRGVSIYDSDLRGAVLLGADLRGAELYGNFFEGADLSGADLSGAILASRGLTEATLSDATYDRHTRWPAGFDPQQAGARLVE